MNYLITASSGFVGSRFLNQANFSNHNFRFLTRDKSIKKTNFFYCDITKEINHNIFLEIDIVIHIAGYAHERQQDKINDNICYKTNYEATLNLANVAEKMGVKKFLYLSSIKAAGRIKGINIGENMFGSLITQYSKSKRKAEVDLLKLSKLCNMKVTILRPALIYGPNIKGNLKLMYLAISKNFMPRPPRVFNRKSMIHVDDVINALMFLSKCDKSNDQIYNLTDNNIYNLEIIYEIYRKHLNKKYNHFYIPKFVYFLIGIIGSLLNKLFYFPYSLKDYYSMFEDSHFSSKKINNLGFKVKNNLKNSINNLVDNN